MERKQYPSWLLVKTPKLKTRVLDCLLASVMMHATCRLSLSREYHTFLKQRVEYVAQTDQLLQIRNETFPPGVGSASCPSLIWFLLHGEAWVGKIDTPSDGQQVTPQKVGCSCGPIVALTCLSWMVQEQGLDHEL